MISPFASPKILSFGMGLFVGFLVPQALFGHQLLPYIFFDSIA
jgi:hypothetical protein